MNKRAWKAIRQMVCVHYECSDENDETYPKCAIKNSYSECPFNKIEYLIVSALKITEKLK